MRRFYTVVFEAVAVAAQQDLFEIVPADDKPIAIMGFRLDNVGGAADAGDAQEEILRLSFVRGHATSGTGGTAPTPIPVDSNTSAAGFTAEVNNTTIASTGTAVIPWAGGWNVRMPGGDLWPEEFWLPASQADVRMCLRLSSTPADSLTVSSTLYVCELV